MSNLGEKCVLEDYAHLMKDDSCIYYPSRYKCCVCSKYVCSSHSYRLFPTHFDTNSDMCARCIVMNTHFTCDGKTYITRECLSEKTIDELVQIYDPLIKPCK